MARTPEGKVKDKVTKQLRAFGEGVWYFSPAANGYGRAGIPDIIVCAWGNFVAIECKAGTNKPTVRQQQELATISLAQGHAMVVNEYNVDQVTIILNDLQPVDIV
jgi:Holliday junction resolvase